MSYDSKDDDFDLLLRQVHQVLDSDSQAPSDFEDEGPDLTMPVRNYSNNYGRGQEPAPSSQIPAYNPDYEQARQSAKTAKKKRPQAQQDRRETPSSRAQQSVPKKKKKRGCGCMTVLLILVLILGLSIGGILYFATPPQTDAPIGVRKDGAASILLCGTDMEGTRTDTMMLLYINSNEDAVNLVSLPRDTLTHTTSGNNAKLNSAFGRNNGKDDPEEGMENLMLYVEDLVGYRPDGYMLIDLEGFIKVVDAMGGVTFDVPQDMYYEDSSQDLYIDLQAGKQKLNGYEAMGLVRFRKGYADQDLGRVNVQRQFISACLEQWSSPTKLPRIPGAVAALMAHCTSDLNIRNLTWLGVNGMKAGFAGMKAETLPGYADMVDGASYYILYPGETADLINRTCNPYEKDITADDLRIFS